jgi:predicted transcriptional regulator
MLPATGARTEARIEGADAGGGEIMMTSDTLIEEINAAYRRLSAATEDLARADRELAEHVRRVRLDNAETILEARNERTASLYLDGLLDTEEHRRVEDNRARAELDLQHARREVERLHLIVRLLETNAREGTRG